MPATRESTNVKQFPLIDHEPMMREEVATDAGRVAVERYSRIVALVGARDPATRRLVEDILVDKQQHVDDLSGWLAV